MGVDVIGFVGAPFLPKGVEARAFFPLETGHAYAGLQNPGPPDAAVDDPYNSSCHSTLHVPAGTLVPLLPFLREADGNAFKRRLRLDPEKFIHRGGEVGEVYTLV